MQRTLGYLNIADILGLYLNDEMPTTEDDWVETSISMYELLSKRSDITYEIR